MTSRTPWSELSDDSQKQLLALENLIRTHKTDCEKVKQIQRLQGDEKAVNSHIAERRSRINAQVDSLSQGLQTVARTMHLDYQALRDFHSEIYKLLQGNQ